MQNLDEIKEYNPYSTAFAATKAFEYTYSLGITEESNALDKIDILTAIAKAENIVI